MKGKQGAENAKKGKLQRTAAQGSSQRRSERLASKCLVNTHSSTPPEEEVRAVVPTPEDSTMMKVHNEEIIHNAHVFLML